MTRFEAGMLRDRVSADPELPADMVAHRDAL